SKVSAGWGRQRIERELEKLGVDVQRYDGYPDDFFEGEDEFERALAELEKYHPRAKNERDARYRHLLSKGYSADVTRRAVADFQRSL
ncbi:MAG: RecX family transcriptional regulator, partial [Coriobacteriales bacterium]|nr:RecX family transcriptional regulator [Coriobacteriales bacterium]